MPLNESTYFIKKKLTKKLCSNTCELKYSSKVWIHTLDTLNSFTAILRLSSDNSNLDRAPVLNL